MLVLRYLITQTPTAVRRITNKILNSRSVENTRLPPNTKNITTKTTITASKSIRRKE